MTPGLHFLGPDGPLSRFPYRSELQRLANRETPYPMDHFIDEAWKATTRLWMLDLHIVPYGYHGLLEALSGAMLSDVRIISAPVKDLANDKRSRMAEIRQVIDAAWNQGSPVGKAEPAPTKVRWIDRLARDRQAYPYPHDRFVVLDDSLWHFGLAACGSGNHLSAASGPWAACEMGAIAFFEELWDWMAGG